MLSKRRNGLLALLCLLMISGILSVQAPTGRVYGTVTDEDGNPLPGVSVEATSPKFIRKATTVTDADGIYRLFALQPGDVPPSRSLCRVSEPWSETGSSSHWK